MRRPADPRQHAAGVIWTAIPAMVIVGALRLRLRELTNIEDARRTRPRRESSASSSRGRSTTTTHRASTSPRPFSTSRRQSGELHGALARRHPRLLGPRLAHEDRRRAGHRHAPADHPEAHRRLPVVCAELCGLGNTPMRQTAHVVTRPTGFDAWVQKMTAGAKPAPATRRPQQAAAQVPARPAKQLVAGDTQTGATACRRLPHPRRRRHERHDRPEPRAGPEGHERGGDPRVDRRPGRRRSPRASQPGLMPRYGDSLTDEQIDALAKYLKEVAGQ